MKLDLKRNIDLYVGQPLIWLFIPITRLLGLILNRDHKLKINGDCLFIKMAGGGSLVIAYPSLKAIKENSSHKTCLLTSKGVAPFAKTLGVFDEIIIVDDSGVISFATGLIQFYLKNFKRFDTVFNFEVHSRLATLISLFTMARNRVGFHRHEFTPFLSLNTHSYFFNIAQSIPASYEEIPKSLNYEIKNPEVLSVEFKTKINELFPIVEKFEENYYSIGIGAVCSDLALERMMPLEFWKNFSKTRLKNINKKIRIYLYGAPSDKSYYEKMIEIVFKGQNVEIYNAAGFKPLGQTINHMGTVLDEYWGIDTSLLHYSRILGIKSHLFWGPTHPNTYLKEFSFLESQNYYLGVGCSPCIHFTRKPPCGGNNICMHHNFGTNN